MDVIIIKRNGDLESKSIDAIHNLYKKCNYRKAKDFENYAEWVVEIEDLEYHIQMYGKTVGKANMENKYEFPPPIAETLFFGDCAIVQVVEGSLVSLSIKDWNIIYEKLFGGFENLDSTAEQDNNEVDELSNVPKHMKTKKGGYLKDGFVVDDDDSAGADDYSTSSDGSVDDDDADVGDADVGGADVGGADVGDDGADDIGSDEDADDSDDDADDSGSDDDADDSGSDAESELNLEDYIE
jgi:hypothetical protein